VVNRVPVSAAAVVVCVDRERELIAREGIDNPACTTTAENLIYVMYTSGSTGQAKGVGVVHRSVVRLVREPDFVDLGSDEVLLQLAPVSFDASTFEVWGALLNGARLVVAPAAALSLAELGRVVRESRVTTLWLTAGLFHQMVDERLADLAGVRQLLAGGDVLSPRHVRKVLEVGGDRVLVNGYGPTENTTFTSCHRMREASEVEATVSIGRPVSRTQVYLLDGEMRLVPVGVAGELYTGGEGLARGYLHRPELTAERFVPHPFSSDERGGRLYRTGDLGRYLADGRVEYLGRGDEQVKVRGYRIEPGEVEAALAGYRGLREAVVRAHEEGSGEKRLVCYVVMEGEGEWSAGGLREHLRERLPEYMIPTTFIQLEEMPLTPNGKVDRRALPAPDDTRGESRDSYQAPRTPIEEMLAGIFASVLRVTGVGIEENFFELGGHSLLATRVVSRVREAFGVELPLRSLFERATVAGLSEEVEALLRGGQELTVPPVRRREDGGAAPLSFAQQRLWFLDQLEPSSAFYNIPIAVRLRGALDIAALELTLSELNSRHEILRTTFKIVDEQPVQVIGAAEQARLPVLDLCGLPEERREPEVRRLIEAEASRPFDLAVGPLVRAQLLKLSEQEHVLLFTMHHIISDGWSMGVLIKEVAALYNAYSQGQQSPLAELPVQYADYAVWQRAWLQGDALENQLEYWRHQLAGAPPVLELPTDRPRPAVQTFRGASQRFVFPKELSERLKELSRQEGATLFMTLLAAFQVFLYKYTGQTDILIGTPIAGRNRAETENLIGFFVNTLVLRAQLSEGLTFRALLESTRRTALEGYAHQDIPFEKLVEELQPTRDLSYSPLFQVMLVLQNVPREKLSLRDLELSSLQGEDGAAKFDLTLFIGEETEGLAGALQYNTDLYDEQSITRMLSHFRQLLAAIVSQPNLPVSQLSVLSPAEQDSLLQLGNNNSFSFAPDRCIQQLFEEQAERTPQQTALVFEDRQLSYAELNRRANQLAHHLNTLGIAPEQVVGLCFERSPEMVIALLAVLKAGAAYLPLDPQYPRERLRFMLEDAGARLLLTSARHRAMVDELTSHTLPRIVVDSSTEVFDAEPAHNPASRVDFNNLAYIIYTSGSTGRPKGVMVTHLGLVNYLSWACDFYGVSTGGGAPLHSPLGFDLSITSLFTPLLAGARLDLLPEAEQTLEALAAALTRRAETAYSLVKVTPAHLELLREMIGEAEQVRASVLVVGGEALSAESVCWWQQRAPRMRIINEYGPTETVVGCSIYEVKQGERQIGSVPIGRAISNMELYVLDERMELLPVGVVGELYIGGVGVARGYAGRAEQTAERFVPHPFSAERGARLYRTGDRGRVRNDGEMEYLGRLDSQVKVRGHRIELGEVEAVLSRHESVSEVVVTALEDVPGNNRLVAYVVAAEAGASPVGELRAYLREQLPEYMIPSAFVMLEEMPLTPNGKVDRRALPAPDGLRPELESRYEEPRTGLERLLAEMWEDVLGVEMVGVYDNFFDLGGTSIRVVVFINRLQERLGVPVSVKALFVAPNIAALSAYLEEHYGHTISAVGADDNGGAPSLLTGLQPVAGSWSPLVEVQGGTGKTPLFFVHPGGGNVFCYFNLARRLGADQPFYALQAKGLNDEQHGHTRIEEMASYYIEHLRAVQPTGPYRIGGWSLGGVVAFEMARQLKASGDEVVMLALIDSLSPLVLAGTEPEDDLSQLANFAIDLGFTKEHLSSSGDDVRRLPLEGQLAYMLDLAFANKLVPAGMELTDLHRLFRVFKTNREALREYVPGAYAGRVTYFQVVGDSAFDAGDMSKDWHELSPGGMDVYRLPGNHFSILKQPHVDALAECIERHLQKIDNGNGSLN